MAFRALHIPVLADEGEVGFSVVEIAGRGEFFGGMAFCAVVRQGSLVVILVALQALLAEPQEGFFVFLEFAVVDKISSVALTAIDPFMLTGKFVARLIVVKILLVEADQVKIPAVVVAVAGGALFTFYFRGNVVAFPLVDPVFQGGMAAQAFVVRHLFSQHMALGAIRHSFQFGMRRSQITGRQLCSCAGGRQEPKKEDEVSA